MSIFGVSDDTSGSDCLVKETVPVLFILIEGANIKGSPVYFAVLCGKEIGFLLERSRVRRKTVFVIEGKRSLYCHL